MQRIGRYEVIEELGRGAMGAVFKARDPQIGRTVAIKIILTANLSPADLEQYKLRFQREAQAAGQMSHPGIITIHDIAEDEAGQPFLVMEFVEGTGLDRLLAQSGPLPLDRSLGLAVQVAEALDYAHQRGVVHRDIKPANILLTADGRAKIADFGIAKLAGVQMTQTGQMMGTPAFMSPEQFSGGAVDARSDLFSLGAMLYWMLTGEKPFGGESLTVVSFRVVYTAPIPARRVNPALPPEVDTVLSRALAKNPADRYASCREFAADLKALREGRMIRTQPVAVPPMEQTVTTVMPLATDTRPAMSTLPAAATAEATERKAPAVGAPVAVEARPVFWTRGRKLAAAAALLLLLLLAGYAFWPGAEPVQPETETAEPAPPPAPKRATPRPASKPAETKPAPSQPAQKEPTVEEILREKGEEILREQLKQKPGKGKGRGR
jgi:serine/threonine-protein kinase